MSEPLAAYLICGEKWHEIDFVRVELLKLLGETAEIRTRVASDYSDIEAIAAADLLITYTCDVRPSDAEQEVGQGHVLYLTLGHCRGPYDMRPMIPVYPRMERGAWEEPVFYELLRRGIRSAAASA